MSKGKVVIGMSGGVDSSVAAALLQRQGYEVIGVTMSLWNGEQVNGGCCSFSASEDAKKVANKLGIPHYDMEYKNEFKKNVIDYFANEYRSGRTPNPCVICNRTVKFSGLIKMADKLGADYIATGHYAKKTCKEGTYYLERPEDIKKDQSYFLYRITQEQLARTLFPLYGITKDETRKIAKEIGLDVANKPDSQDICFIPDGDYARFIERNYGKMPVGDFTLIDGTVVGKHKGLLNYTIGQRKGLGIALNKPMYVVKIDALNNQVVLGENGTQLEECLKAFDVNYISNKKIDKNYKCTAKIRYNSADVPCRVNPTDDGFDLVFDQPQKSVTPGQMVVLYDEGTVIGGGIIGV